MDVVQKSNMPGFIPVIIKLSNNKIIRTFVVKQASIAVLKAIVNQVIPGAGGVVATLFFVQSTLLSCDIKMGDLYEKFKDGDGNLVISMMNQSVFG